MNSLEDIIDWIKNTWNIELFKLGSNEFTIKTFLLLSISFFLLFFFSGKLKRLLVKVVFPRYNVDIGVSESIATIIKYLLLIVGIVIIFQTTGIDLSALGLLVGALGVGIGFGLQGITNNFISGIIILFERPIKVGDRIEVEGLTGNIVEINARASTIITNDNITVIVPNSDFINKQVINWSHNNKNIRLNIPIGVSYKEDPQVVTKILMGIAKLHPGVLEEPPPYVRFDEFGDSSLKFTLQIWTLEYIDRPSIIKSDIYYEVFRIFKEKNIEIPYPQRDIHIKESKQ
ncbi:MAG: mechanosensitive ion channel protein MscS [Bacteroidetes bacterium GWF2_41_61]|nr:MAG: mechanosensitive ion channel protein MscS [Bacteroidetes bacterium GWE2_40_15]OFY34679.1 MAG: mechanosensitive ion channel protein MscS [Bacteroidetes bacterium GWF2_41_61]OFY88290.1 MAG: mechanosensitive ion channel protein MscS [Bacteroidetes bacterium RIFOXYA12_FULL_40_10]HBG23540.1 mechanosensitive ion channel protein MscS [Rikenellaceae bacterium]HBZ25885.1 mechanosensitive ion channel protein MscS [Rikenellaceae bacterium]